MPPWLSPLRSSQISHINHPVTMNMKVAVAAPWLLRQTVLLPWSLRQKVIQTQVRAAIKHLAMVVTDLREEGAPS